MYYHNSGVKERELVFQYYNSSMNGNYTCHTSTGSLSVIIEEGEKRREREREREGGTGGREECIGREDGVYSKIFILFFSKGVLTVLLAQQSISLSDDESTTISFPVFVAGIPQPTAADARWYFNGGIINSSNFAGFTFFSGLFVLSGPHSSHGGVYTLNVTTTAGTASASFYLTVECKLLKWKLFLFVSLIALCYK